ncbi:ADP-ribosylglycohydrolase family protein [Planctomycetota bacterium]
MIGGAIGDALGAPIEFESISQIRNKYGEEGIRDYDEAYDRIGAITDDTQMAMFTAEGLLRAWNRGTVRGICHTPSVVHHAYVQWLNTQGEQSHSQFNKSQAGFLIHIPKLHNRRAPGNSCLSALRKADMGTIDRPVNDSKGCGGIMRIAPVGLFTDSPESAFELGCEIAAITHGHPLGYLAAGVLSAIINSIKTGIALKDSIDIAIKLLKQRDDHQECFDAIERAIDLAEQGNLKPDVIEALGGGWVAEETLAISLYCSLCTENDFSKGVLAAVNHSGDSDSTGAITGNILGCINGISEIPLRWIDQLELREVIETLAIDLFIGFRNDDQWSDKYPGW